MSKLGLLVVHIRSADRVFWRNPASAFFTLALPVMFLILFSVLFGTKPTGVNGHQVNSATFTLAGIVTFSVIGACYTNLAIGMTFAREGGFLKRLRGTPLPPWVYLTARIIHAVLVAGLLVVIAVAFSALAYGVRIPLASVPPLVVSLVIGAACFSSLGLAVTAIIPNADASPAIVNAAVFRFQRLHPNRPSPRVPTNADRHLPGGTLRRGPASGVLSRSSQHRPSHAPTRDPGYLGRGGTCSSTAVLLLGAAPPAWITRP
jgi:ABC-2 type transport system permease protein